MSGTVRARTGCLSCQYLCASSTVQPSATSPPARNLMPVPPVSGFQGFTSASQATPLSPSISFSAAASTCALVERSLRRSEEHTSELQSQMRISYAVFCLQKKKTDNTEQNNTTTINRRQTPYHDEHELKKNDTQEEETYNVEVTSGVRVHNADIAYCTTLHQALTPWHQRARHR